MKPPTPRFWWESEKLVGFVSPWRDPCKRHPLTAAGHAAFEDMRGIIWQQIHAKFRVDWGGGGGLVTKSEMFEHLTHSAQEYRAVESFPHHPPMPGHCYLHPPPGGGDGSALGGLLCRFQPATDEDRALILAFLMTLAWGGPPGARPAFLLTAADADPKAGRGTGKTTLAKLAAALFGGHVSVQAATDDIGKVKTRLLSAGARGRRVVLVDNVKTHKFSWSDVEAQITDPVVSGHEMYAGEGQRPNTLVFVITLNGASLSKDLAQRSVIIKLGRPDYSADWEEDVLAYIEAHRWAVIGDLLALLASPAPDLKTATRWGAWERGVLARVPDPLACQRAITQRQGDADEDEEEAGRVRAEVERVIRDAGYDPADQCVQFDSGSVVEIVTRAKNERQTSTAASGYLRTLAIPELVKRKRNGMALWFWVGRNAEFGEAIPAVFDRPSRTIRVGIGVGPVPP